MIPIVCIVGASDSGKTTFLEKLIPELTRRGYRVGALKHDAHGFEMDHEGKDTWKLRRAGAQTVAISSPAMVAAIRKTDGELDPREVAGRLFWDEDILLTEGYKRSHFPKIEVFRAEVEPAPICGPKDNLVAIVTGDPVSAEVPVFPFSDAAGVAALIEDRFLKERKKRKIQVQLDGKQLPMNEFVSDIVCSGIVGMLSTLRGWESARDITIRIRPEEG
jgi:molybdopterin-guanine dinucleotide biosynthesis adapter protein